MYKKSKKLRKVLHKMHQKLIGKLNRLRLYKINQVVVLEIVRRREKSVP